MTAHPLPLPRVPLLQIVGRRPVVVEEIWPFTISCRARGLPISYASVAYAGPFFSTWPYVRKSKVTLRTWRSLGAGRAHSAWAMKYKSNST